MAKSFPSHKWDKPTMRDKGYTIRAGTPLGPRSDRPPSDVLMISSTFQNVNNKRPSSELTSGAKKRKTIENDLKMKLQTKSSSSSSRRSSPKSHSATTSRTPRTPVNTIRVSAAPSSASKSDELMDRNFRWYTPPSPPLEIDSYNNRKPKITSADDGDIDGGDTGEVALGGSGESALKKLVHQTAAINTEAASVRQLNNTLEDSAVDVVLGNVNNTDANRKKEQSELDGDWHQRNKERAASGSGYKGSPFKRQHLLAQFKTAVCPSYDRYGDPCKAQECLSSSRCSFAHPEDAEWQELLKSGVAKTRVDSACPHYDVMGESRIIGGCPDGDSCPFYHPWHAKWLKLRGSGTLKSPKLIRCKHYTRHGEPIQGGCWPKRQGSCGFVHPNNKDWNKAVNVTPSPVSSPGYYQKPVYGKGTVRQSRPFLPSWMRPLPFKQSPRMRSHSVDGYEGYRARDFTGRRASGSFVAGGRPQFALGEQASDKPLEAWVRHIREGIVADAAHSLARDALARHDAFLASGVAPASDPAILKETKQLTERAIASREVLNQRLASLGDTTGQVVTSCASSPSNVYTSFDRGPGYHAIQNNIYAANASLDGFQQRIRSLELVVVRQQDDMARLLARVDDNARALKTRNSLSSRIYELEDDLKYLRSSRRKEKQGVADQMMDLQKEIRNLRHGYNIGAGAIKSQLKRELKAELAPQLMIRPAPITFADPAYYPFPNFPVWSEVFADAE